MSQAILGVLRGAPDEETDMGDLEFIQGFVTSGNYFQVSGDIDTLNDTIEYIVADGKTAFLIEAKITITGHTSGTTTKDMVEAALKMNSVVKDTTNIGTATTSTLITNPSDMIAGSGSGAGTIGDGRFNVLGLSLVGGAAVQATGTVTCVGVLAADAIAVNQIVYLAVSGTKANNTEFSIDTGDDETATDLADSITNDTRTGVDEPTVDQTAIAATNVVTITASLFGDIGNNVGLTSTNGTRLAVSGSTLTGGVAKTIEIENTLADGTAFATMSGYLIDT
jgi:hypothetical protein